MSALERQVSKFITFRAPKMVTVQDWRLGLAHKVLQLFFVIIIFQDLVGNKKYLDTRVPTGFAGFWASEGNMLQDQMYEIDTAATTSNHYCNSNHDYFEDLLLGKYANSVCELQDYNELHLKGENEMFISTSYIQETTAVQDCSAKDTMTMGCVLDYAAVKAAVPDPPTPSHGPAAAKKECYCMRDRTKYVDTMTGQSSPGNNDRCTCTSRRHVFTPGVEALSINFEAGMSITWPSGFGVCSGSSIIAKPKLYVRERGKSENLYEFKQGEKLELPMKVLLDLAKLGDYGLDSENKVTTPTADGSVAIDEWGHSQNAYNKICSDSTNRPAYCNSPWVATPSSQQAADQGRVPTYRQTGLAIGMNVKFHHECGKDSETYAVVEISNRNIAWNSKGSEIQWQGPKGAYPEIDPVTKRRSHTYTDTYKFGVKIVFTFEGTSTRTDVGVIIQKVGEAFVFVMLSSSIMSIIVFYLIPNAKFFRTRRDEEVNFDHINARLAAQTAMGILSFKNLDCNHNGEVSVNELEKTFTSMYPPATAKAMAVHIMELADTSGDGKLSFNEFMRIIVEDVKSFDIMLHSLRPDYTPTQAGAEKLPPPFQMWEKRTTPDGLPYFANNDTKTTSWADPRSQIVNQTMMQQQQFQVPQQIVVAGGQPVVPVAAGGQIVPQGGQQMTA